MALTIYVAWSVRRIRNQFLATARLPQLASRLEEHTMALSASLVRYRLQRDEAATEIAAMEATLESLQRLTSGSERREVGTILALIQRYRSGESEEVVQAIRREAGKLALAVRHLEEDVKWLR